MTQERDIREAVSEQYARAVATSVGCCGTPEQKGVTAKLAGYDAGELAALPADAVVNSFGCGNPLAFSDVLPGETVLDLGSGAGIDLLLAAEKVGPQGRVIGVDMTEAMIERARANAAAAGHANVDVRRGFIEELPVADGSVDLVISNCVINLSPDKPRVFNEIVRVLKPGGRVRIADLVVDDLPAWARENVALYASCIGGAISEEAYVRGLEEAGLEEVEVRERLVYDAEQLTALVISDLDDSPSAGGCCGGDTARGSGAAEAVGDLLRERAGEVAGKVWSALFVGRKPIS